jgi:NAD(P)-dependent dehydrogenase (short-subunit alcohol dehydrogenase family)
MPSRYADPESQRRYAELRYDLKSRALVGRVVVVVGGTGGLGAVVTAMLLADGALPVAVYRSNRGRALLVQQKLQDRYGGLVTLVEADVEDDADRQRCLQAALDIKGELYGSVLLVDAQSGASAARAPSNHLGTRGIMAHDCAETMRRMGTRGAIVLVARLRMAGVAGEIEPPSASSDRSLLQVTRRLAREYGGGSDIRVNTVALGVTGVGLTRSAVEAGEYDLALERGGLTRLTRPEDMARAVRFLLEPDNHMTGQLLTVDGGLSLGRDRS